MNLSAKTLPLPALREIFGSRLQEGVRLANYTSARVGGLADALLVAGSLAELEEAVTGLWEIGVPFLILGSGANVLVSDRGVRGVVIINRAHTIKIEANQQPPAVFAESGANIGTVARQVALRGLSGLEWAATIPGSIGGAVYGNAGAHGSDMQANLILAEILHPDLGRQTWTCKQMAYEYRTSALKRNPRKAVILAARLGLEHSTPDAVKTKMEEFSQRRKQTQPPGASLGSMFKNPPGDFAGRLIEAAGLKGARVGGVEVSQVHANFFVNHENATANDYHGLIEKVRRTVADRTGVDLELEIELVGDWLLDGVQG